MEGLQDHVPKRALPPLGKPLNSTLSFTPSPPVVRFLEPSVAIIESSWGASEKSSSKMQKQLYESFYSDQVTDAMLERAAKFFSENYGTWGEHSHSPGKPVKLGPRRLREQYLSDSSASYHVVTVDGNLAGNAFACRWRQGGKNICWVTQLVIDKEYRERGLASGLLRSLRLDADDIYGVMSSHAAACLAAASTFGTSIEKVSLSFIKENAESIMQASPIPYIREAKLRGTLFEPEGSTGLVCGVDTEFFVDHEEPIEALKMVQETWEWPLGDLLDGHEFLLILPGKRRRSRSRSSSKTEKGVFSGL